MHIWGMENTELTFEDFGNENGNRYWLASDLMRLLDYPNMRSFKNVIDRASLSISGIKNVDQYDEIRKQDDGDYRLSRFACFIIALRADPKKKKVQDIQVYFAHIAEEMHVHLERQSAQAERISLRKDLKESFDSMSKAAKSAGVSGNVGYANFNNAGWIGMYNKRSGQIAKQRGIIQVYDSMGRVELLGNVFRMTLTKERLNKDNVQGQANAESTHHKVGGQMRNLIKENTGKNPEDLPQESLLIHTVVRKFKQIRKVLKKQDKGKLPPKGQDKK